MSPFGATRTILGLVRPEANCFTVNPAGTESDGSPVTLAGADRRT